MEEDALEEGVLKDTVELEGAGLNGDGEGEQEGSANSVATTQKIHDSICTSVLPELQECLVKRVSVTFVYSCNFTWYGAAVRLLWLVRMSSCYLPQMEKVRVHYLLSIIV